MRAIWVSHSHWDREWYRSFQAFRARLVDAVDRVLDLCALDPGYRFLLDGQAIVLEDYAEIRPQRVRELRARCVEGRLGIGPWFVQPDSLLPGGEAHVRNLLEGRRAAARFGPVSSVAYTPDSFGHPAQFPQLFAGFGLRAFVYWRGNGSEWDDLPAEYQWVAPDGTGLLACNLGRGYFSAASDMDATVPELVQRVAETAKALAARSETDVLLLMNGIDHMPPEERTEQLVRELEAATGLPVRRGLVDDFVEEVEAAPGERPRFAGELLGARVAPLLPGVWSSRAWIKQANRAAERELLAWAEPWSAIGRVLGLADERPALRLGWRALLANQAHDSICGCSVDLVHEQMRPRFDTARELARETAERSLERIAGQGPVRRPPWSEAFDLAVFNPSPRPRTDRVRFVFDPHPYMVPSPDPARMLHPTALFDLSDRAFLADGSPARWLRCPGDTRPGLLPGLPRFALEFVARDVPAFGWKRVRITRVEEPGALAEQRETVAPGSAEARVQAEATSGPVGAALRADGRFDAWLGGRRFEGLGVLQDLGDRGDSYDFDPVEEGGEPVRVELVRADRVSGPCGVEELVVEQRLHLPDGLSADRERRSAQTVEAPLGMRLSVVPGVARLGLVVEGENPAPDHRLRIGFPVAGVEEAFAATTFDVVRRPAGRPDDAGWVHPAPRTFPHQGFVHAGGLTVVAPGLPEAEWDGQTLWITLLRATGFLSRHDLRSRPGPAGPGIPTPGGQVRGPFRAQLWLLQGLDPAAAQEAEDGLRAVPVGSAPLLDEGEPAISLDPSRLLLTALKSPEDGEGLIVRVSNPTDRAEQAQLRLGPSLARRLVHASMVRLDETPSGEPLALDAGSCRFAVPPHALRTVRLRPGGAGREPSG